jgi:gamma-glutamyltranspeptidase/glutathione hydrolase
MAFGLMGGPIQAQGHVQMFLRTQLWNQDPQTAADAPRWRFMNGLNVAIEPAAGEDLLAGLEHLGHRIIRETPQESFGFGGPNSFMRSMAASSQGLIHVKTGMPLASDGLTQRCEIQAMWTMYGYYARTQAIWVSRENYEVK